MQSVPAPKSRSAPYLQYAFSGLIFIAFIVFVEIYFGWKPLLEPWTELSIGTLTIAIGLIFVSYWVRAMRFYDYFLSDMKGSFMLCFKLMLQHNLLNNLLPMRTGEISFPVLMARYFSVPVMRSVPALLWFRLMDLHTLGLIGLGALASHWFGIYQTLFIVIIWTPLPWLAFKMNGRILKWVGVEPQNKPGKLLRKVLAGLPQDYRAFLLAWMWTLLNWTVKLSVFAWVLMQFIDISLEPAWAGAIGGDLSSVLPIHSFAGAGTYEAGVVGGLILFSIPAATALPAAINLHLFLLASTLLSGPLSLLIKNKKNHG